jgi:hypothetical protein
MQRKDVEQKGRKKWVVTDNKRKSKTKKKQQSVQKRKKENKLRITHGATVVSANECRDGYNSFSGAEFENGRNL